MAFVREAFVSIFERPSAAEAHEYFVSGQTNSSDSVDLLAVGLNIVFLKEQ